MRAAIRIGRFPKPVVPSAGFSPTPTVDMWTTLINEGLTRISGKTPSDDTWDMFSTYDYINHIYVRNPNFFVKSLDFTCVPAASSSLVAPGLENGVLVTPDILIQASHAYSTGVHYFLDKDSNTFTRNIISYVDLGNDMHVARLDSPLPSSIKPAKILDTSVYSGHRRKLRKNASTSNTIPIYGVRQNKKMHMFVCNTLDFVFDHTNNAKNPDVTSAFYPWNVSISAGDSGSPYFFIINNETVALGTWSFGGNAPGGPAISANVAATNSAIASLGSTTTLTILDGLDNFTTYRE